MRIEPEAGVPQRHPILERLLAVALSPEGIDDWRLDVQRQLQGPDADLLSAAPAAWCHARQAQPLLAPDVGQVFLAQPLHTQATIGSVRLPADGLLTVTADEAQQLAEDFSALPPAVSADPIGAPPQQVAVGCQLFFCFANLLQADNPDPGALLGFDLRDWRPRGAQAARLAALGSEVEMWLFDHRVNRARRERGEPSITALWPWGGGGVRASLPPLPFRVLGDDPLFGAWARCASSVSVADALVIWRRCSHPISLDALLAPFLPALRVALRRGRGAVFISAGRRRFTVRRMPRRWFARRVGPWWESFDEID